MFACDARLCSAIIIKMPVITCILVSILFNLLCETFDNKDVPNKLLTCFKTCIHW